MKKIISIWMIALIISLPIYSAYAMGGLANVKAHGGVEPAVDSCMRAEAEYVLIEARASIDGDSAITPNQVKVNTHNFNTCEPSGISYYCRFNQGSENARDWDTAPPLEIELVSDTGAVVDTYSPRLVIDSTAPVISKFYIMRNGGVIDGAKIAPDTAGIELDFDVSDDCSGVASAAYYVNGVFKGATPSSPISAESLKPGAEWPSDGKLRICVTATDVFGNSLSLQNAPCKELTIDAAPPQFNTLKVNGQSFLATNGKQRVAVMVFVTDRSGLKAAYANFKELGSTDEYKAGNCGGTSSSRCEWSVVVNLQGEGTKTIYFKAEDNAGNIVENYPISIGYSVDSSAPEVEFEKEYVKAADNEFTAVVHDNSGIRKSDIRLDLATLYGGAFTKEADDCSKEVNEYVCTWNIPNAVRASHGEQKTIYLYAKDVLGNEIDVRAVNVVIDKEKPELWEQEAEQGQILAREPGKQGSILLMPTYTPVDGKIIGTSRLALSAVVKDSTKVRAHADFSRIAEGANDAWIDCEQTTLDGLENFWSCDWSYSDVGGMVVPENARRRIDFIFEDAAGNKIERAVDVEITREDIIIDSIAVKAKSYDNIVEAKEYVVGNSPLDIKAYIRTATNSLTSAAATFDEGLGIAKNGKREKIPADSCIYNEEKALIVCTWDTANWDSRPPKESPPVGFDIKFEFTDPNNNYKMYIKKVYIKTPALAVKNITVTQDLSALFGGQQPPLSLGNENSYLVNGFIAGLTARVGHTGGEDADAVVSAKADFSELAAHLNNVQGVCHFKETFWECTWQGIPANSSEKKAKVYFVFEDVLGNRLPAEGRYERELDILTVKDTEEDYWKVKSVETLPPVMDRQTVPIFSQRVYFMAPLNLKPGFNPETVKTLHISKPGCTAMPADSGKSDDFVEGGVQGINLMNVFPGTTEPWLNLNLKTGKEITFDNLRFNCTLAITTKDGNYISLPEEEHILLTIPFYNMPLGELGADLQNKIDGVRDSALFKLSETLSFLEEILYFAEQICRFVRIFKEIDTAYAIVVEFLDILRGHPGGAAVADRAQGSSLNLHFGGEKIFEKMYKFCQYVSCEKSTWGNGLEDWRKKIAEATPGWAEEMHVYGIISDTETGEKQYSAEIPVNPKDSLILSMATGCLPGMIYNLKKWRQIECQYAFCLKQEVLQGVAPSICDKQRSYLKCKYVFGEIFNVIPFAHFVKYLGGIVQAFLNDPASLLFGSAVFYCNRQYPVSQYPVSQYPVNAMSTACILAKDIPELARIVADIKNGQDIKWSLKEDICDQAFKEPEAAAEATPTEGGNA